MKFCMEAVSNTSKWRQLQKLSLKNEDNLKNKDSLKDEDDPKNEDNLKN